MKSYDNLGDKLPSMDWSNEKLKPFEKNFYKVSGVLELSMLGTRRREVKIWIRDQKATWRVQNHSEGLTRAKTN